ncbi:MAG TPA: trehalose-6-phosphate synthase [Nitrospira sp.]|nr:trehalose-6-phosphate synthase [Nitrospira sp.]
MDRLIVVSNRQPYEHHRENSQLVCLRTDGGLTSALDPVLRRCGGTWIAWGSGPADHDVVGPDNSLEVPPNSPAYRLRRVWLSPDEVKDGYLGYANQVLWPLCHITLDRITYLKAFWPAYRSQNLHFAEAVLEELDQETGQVWIHDFHLALLPAMVKAIKPTAPVSVFWHIPWPAPEVWRILPERREVLIGLLASDLIVFQTPSYAEAFLQCAQEFLCATVHSSRNRVLYENHETRVLAHPISVDFRMFSEHARRPSVEETETVLRQRFGLRAWIRVGLGIDRLDYTKGLLKRLWALDTFFSQFPEYRGQFTFLQVAVPTRNELEAYQRYRDLIRETVTEINQRHVTEFADATNGKNGWMPIALYESRIGFDELVALYRMADLALVSSVYDGMNLVAKEYVAAQVGETGVLLVSQMAGAAEGLPGAIVINPYQTEGVAEAIKQALEMPSEERRRRMRRMRSYLSAQDVHAWADRCLNDGFVGLPR